MASWRPRAHGDCGIHSDLSVGVECRVDHAGADVDRKMAIRLETVGGVSTSGLLC